MTEAKKTTAKKPPAKKPVAKKTAAPKAEKKPEVLVLMKNRKGDMMNVPSSKISEYQALGYTEA